MGIHRYSYLLLFHKKRILWVLIRIASAILMNTNNVCASAILMSTHSVICFFYEELEKIILELSSNNFSGIYRINIVFLEFWFPDHS